MENAATKPYRRIRPEHNHKGGGVVLVIIGILFLLNRIPATAGFFPHWFFTWPMILIAIGVFTGVKHGFRNAAWIILLLIGGYFLLAENDVISLNLRPYIFPIAIIAIGLVVIFKKNRLKKQHYRHHHRFHKHWQQPFTEEMVTEEISDNVVNVSATFGSIERNVFSKDFKGGTISSVFGGAQVNFAQADFQGTAVLDVSIVFGGADIIIPSNWNLKNELSVVFGGVEDRRTVSPNVSESGKTLILRGDVVFGGIEIKSF